MQEIIISTNFLFDNYSINYVKLTDIFCVVTAIAVITVKNPITSVLFLIALILGLSCHLILSGLTFIGLSYLLVYVGAVSILMLFILMLINIRVSELTNQTKNTIPLTSILAPILSLYLLTVMPSSIMDNHKEIAFLDVIKLKTTAFIEKLYLASSNGWDNSLAEVSAISNIGDIMYTNYSIWLIITSIILLLSMVGAIVITIKKPQA